MCECGEFGSPEHKVGLLSGPDIVELRAQLGEEDLAELLRNPERLEVLGKLTDAVSNAELEIYMQRQSEDAFGFRSVNVVVSTVCFILLGNKPLIVKVINEKKSVLITLSQTCETTEFRRVCGQ